MTHATTGVTPVGCSVADQAGGSACGSRLPVRVHEGNYAMTNILGAARAEEKAAENGARKRSADRSGRSIDPH